MIELVWDDESGEGQVKITKEFLTAHRIVQLDALVDWIEELKEIYDAMVVIP
jgi:hypothetical protein